MDSLEKTFIDLRTLWLGKSSEPFSDKVLELAYEPIHVHSMDNPDAVGKVDDECGDVFDLFLKLAKGMIVDASFLSDGCGAVLACGSALCDLLPGKTVQEAGRLQIGDIVLYLEGLPESHRHCAEQALQALQKALVSIPTGRSIDTE